MRMKNILFFLITISLFSCCRNKYEKKLVGNWYSVDESEKITIGRDSLYIQQLYRKVKWFSTKDSIKFRVKQMFNKDSVYNVSLKYTLNKDTLFIVPNNSKVNNPIKFIKTENFLDFLFSKYSVNIDLPINYNIETIDAKPNYGIKIFLESRNDSIFSKTQYSDNLNNLERDLEAHISPFKKKIKQFKKDVNHIYKNLNDEELEDLWVRFNVHFSIFADKEITKKELRFFYNKLKEVKRVNKIYRVYDIDESEYVDFYRLKGVEL